MRVPHSPREGTEINVSTTIHTKLWQLALERPEIDAGEWAEALEDQVQEPELDYRSRLLVRRGVEALERVWGEAAYGQWLERSPGRDRFADILAESFGEIGFPSLTRRVVMATKPETVEQYLRELGSLVSEPTRLVVGGAIALILQGYLTRRTEDIDVPDEVGTAIRSRREPLERLAERYGLRIAHFQSHYLPAGWQNRLLWQGDFGRLNVYVVDPYDLFVGKLCSRRDKDRDDVRVLARRLEKRKIIERLGGADNLLGDAALKQAAEENWYIVYGESLPEKI